MSNVVRLEEYSDNLEVGAKLLNGQFTIEKFINCGGFGITYLARNSLDKLVVIKECYPNAICRRSGDAVAARSSKHEPDFANSIEIFVREAQNLAKLSHKNIVRVHQVFNENNTAYMVIDYVEGRDLQQIIEDDFKSLTPDYLVELLTKLLGAIKATHAQRILHRDISPDNILIDKDGEPVLIDFGAARDDVSKKSRVLSTLNVIKDGYSPQEFYVAGSLQSDSSDLYALGATMYHCISGEMPPNSQLRLAAVAEGREGPYVPLSGRFQGYPENFLEAIDQSLQVIPKDRVQSAQEWAELIDPESTRELRAVLGATGSKAASSGKKRGLLLGGAAAALLLVAGAGGYAIFSSSEGNEASALTQAVSAPEQPIETISEAPNQNTVEAKPVLVDNTIETTQPKIEFIAKADTLVAEPTAKEEVTIAENVPETGFENPFSALTSSGAFNEPLSLLSAVSLGSNELAIDTPSIWERTKPTSTKSPLISEQNFDVAIAPAITQAATDAQKLQVEPLAEAPKVIEKTIVGSQAAPETESTPTKIESAPFDTNTESALASKQATIPNVNLDSAVESGVEKTAIEEDRVIDNILAGLENVPDRADPATPSIESRTSNVITDLENVPDMEDNSVGELAPIFELISPVPVKPSPVQKEETGIISLASEPKAQSVTPIQTELKISISDWDFELPFLLGDSVTSTGVGSFPIITTVKQSADVEFAGDWIKPGVTIYALNGELLPPAIDVESFLRNGYGQNAPNSISATARISRTQGAPAEDVVLQLSFVQSLSLSNGFEVKQRLMNGQWQMVVTKLPISGTTNLEVGDVLLKERSFGVDLNSVKSVVAMIKLLAGNGVQQADLSIKRGTKTLVGGLKL